MTTVCDPGIGLFRAMEDAQWEADARYERADEMFGDLLYENNWDGHTHARDWTIEDVAAELVGEELQLLTALYWLDGPDNRRKHNAQSYLNGLSKRLTDRLNERIDEQLAREDNAAQEAWELRHVD